MADALEWPIEEIPDTDSMFMRAHKVHFIDGELQAGVFRPQGEGMSVNWCKYASTEETRLQAKNFPENNAVIALPVIGIRQIEGLGVQHTPIRENRAHSEVFGIPDAREQLVEIRMRLRRIARCVLPIEPSPSLI
jgi:hypothetical protein